MKHSDYDKSQSSPDRGSKQKPNKQIPSGYKAQADFKEPEYNEEFRLFDQNEIYDVNSQFFFNSYKRDKGESGEGIFIRDSCVKFTNQGHNDIESYWNLDPNLEGENDNDNCFKYIDQIVNDSGIQSDEEEKFGIIKREELQSKCTQKIDTDEYKLKSVKPNSKILRK